MRFELQPILQNEQLMLHPLFEEDFEELYATASDPLIWEQHPNKDRWKKDVFRVFFDGAIQSQGAFKIIDKATGRIAGSTRFYDHDPRLNSVAIGYTFYARDYWGKGINPAVKAMMLDHAFRFVSQVYFHIGAYNIRSQVAIGRLGAEKVEEREVAYYGEGPKLNFIYLLGREKWRERNKAE